MLLTLASELLPRRITTEPIWYCPVLGFPSKKNPRTWMLSWSVFETYCQNTDRDTFLTPRFQFFSLWHTTDDSPRTSSHTSQPSQLSVNVPWFWLPQCSAQRTFWKEKLILLWPDIDVFVIKDWGRREEKQEFYPSVSFPTDRYSLGQACVSLQSHGEGWHRAYKYLWR